MKGAEGSADEYRDTASGQPVAGFRYPCSPSHPAIRADGFGRAAARIIMRG